MRAVICFEASHQRGMGHLFRSRVLALTLRERGNEVVLVANQGAPGLERLTSNSFPVLEVPRFDETPWEESVLAERGDVVWINDRLDTSAHHARLLKERSIPLITFDDHGTGASLADLNVLAMEPSPERQVANGRYGPAFMILDPMVRTLPSGRSGDPPTVLLTFGGSDTYGVTPRALRAIAGLSTPCRLQVVIGPAFQHHAELEQALQTLDGPCEILRDVPALLPWMASATVLVCAGGVTLYEAAALGIPAITISNEPHEQPVARYFASVGASRDAGYHADSFELALRRHLHALLADPAERARMAASGRAAVDGRGVDRIADLIERLA